MWNDAGPPFWDSSPRTGLYTERGRSRGSMMDGAPGAFFSRGGLGPVGWGGKAVGTIVCPRGAAPFLRPCHHTLTRSSPRWLCIPAIHMQPPPLPEEGSYRQLRKDVQDSNPQLLGVQITCWFCTTLFPQAEREPPDRGGSLFELTVVKGEERAAPQAQSFL